MLKHLRSRSRDVFRRRRYHDAESRCKFCKDLEVLRPGVADDYLTKLEGDWQEFVLTQKCPYQAILYEGLARLDPDLLSPSAGLMSKASDLDRRKPNWPQNVFVSGCNVGFLVARDERQGSRIGSPGVEFRVLFDGRRKEYGRNRLPPAKPGKAPEVTALSAAWVNLDRNNDGEDNRKFLRNCFQTCIEKHPKCTMRQSRWNPERLVAIEDGGLRVIETSEELASQYIALSYCWGKGASLLLNHQTKALVYKGIPFSEVPAVYRDAVTLAQELQVSYLWIDALCIIQGDQKDWEHNAEQMHLIYQNAYLVLAAVTSPNTNVPFLGPKAPTDRSILDFIELESGKHLGAETRVFARKLMDRWLGGMRVTTEHGGPLDRRAWSWQERTLSTRCFRYQSGELVWDCATARIFEGAPNDEQPNGRLWLTDSSKMTFNQWQDIIDDYSDRRLTYNTDRLPAIAGAAAYFSHTLKSRYLAGLWEANLIDDLTWSQVSEIDWQTSSLRVSKDSMTSNPQLPTWSWASVAGRVNWLYFDDEERMSDAIEQVQVVKCVCEPAFHNSFGQFKPGALLILRGHLLEAELEASCDGDMVSYLLRIDKPDSQRWVLSKMQTLDTALCIEKATNDAGEVTGMRWRRTTLQDDPSSILVQAKAPVTCLLVTRKDPKRSRWLLLSRAFEDQDIYQRLSAFMDAGPIYDMCSDTEMKEVKLV